ncbi:cyclin-like protein interacting with PHO85 [Exophiala xenobiotica]|uniref:Cyclin-like protein interacting with PHO85 n=1 Tax=Vermiconidia calcicola TaxID=1690605 RepID=A0AAV9QKD9_9PEZI|nr:cyclin-like protein interacting with PHO85 [Exophiala xenobiotica]KAK5542415.1 cyclin-like protein interacting with PHO85 [Vermiconidia calcicola]KAK5546273.1 cyclin-like protein interacting with PHO85 [Chaetothyriales sp. CCFEE 6169]KAK5255255.1 cyclin-like protein interacting with PHO85 [Exophiala xenobiotica]KAK5298793.1 cyclin-like protein interacting with PHO85 [Exophiala xenobiotica]
MMVDSNSQPDEASQSSRARSASASATIRQRGNTDAASGYTTPTVQEPSENTSTPVSHPVEHEPSPSSSQSSYHSQNVNQHSRGFDQSGFPLSNDPRVVVAASPPSPRLQPTYRSTRSLGGSEATSPSRIKVRDLSHIRSFASEEYLARPRLGARSSSAFSDSGRQYEISSMPVTDIIEMVAGLLTKITTTNDRQHEHHRPIPLTEEQSHLHSHASCVLAFHGKNVPGITILSYLSRIHKYCPTTYEVFLSLLVYFDRMTEMVNRGLLGQGQRRPDESPATAPESSTPTGRSPMPMTVDSPLDQHDISEPPSSSAATAHAPGSPTVSGSSTDLSQFFVVDSYNIHRLVIAGVTCASKFFSDVFYTNSRYAKVGGLPLAELNNLELQFLLLNDFRLSVPVEELEAYGTMLVEFYARELVAQQQVPQAAATQSHAGEGMYMRAQAGSRTPAAPTS